MPNDVSLQTVLASTRRSLRSVFAHWLARKELARPRDEQIILFLTAAQQSMARRRVLTSVSPGARALLLQNATAAESLTIGELLASVAAAGHPVSLATVGELHAVGLAFLDNAECWPQRTLCYTREVAGQTLTSIPGLTLEELHVPAAVFAVTPRQPRVAKQHGQGQDGLARLLEGMSHAISRGVLRLTQEGTLTTRTRDALARMRKHAPRSPLCDPAALLSFFRATGVASVDSAGQVRPGNRFARSCTQNRAQQVCAYLNFCVENLATSPGLSAACGYAPERFAITALCAILRAAPDDAWLSLADITTAIARQASQMHSTARGIAQWSWKRSACSRLPTTRWSALVQEFTLMWLEPAGVVGILRSRTHGICLRLTSVGACWLKGAKPPVHKSAHQQLVVQPDFTAVLTHSGPFDRVAQLLNLFASRTGDDNASVFHFTRERVQTAVRHGHRIEELLNLLRQRSSYEVPDNVIVTLREWATINRHITLYRDINIFTFENRVTRDRFLEQHRAHDRVAIADNHALLLAPERDIFNIMQVLRAIPVDYTDPPIGGIEIRPDGEVTSTAMDDFRIVALCEALGTPVDVQEPSGQTVRRYYFSFKRMRMIERPDDVYEYLVHLPGRPLPLNTRLNLLVGLGLVEPSEDDRYLLIQGLEPPVRAKLRSRADLRVLLRAPLTKDMHVLNPNLATRLRETLSALHSRAHVGEISMVRIPVKQPRAAAG